MSWHEPRCIQTKLRFQRRCPGNEGFLYWWEGNRRNRSSHNRQGLRPDRFDNIIVGRQRDDVIFLQPQSSRLYLAIGDPGAIDPIHAGTMRRVEVVPTKVAHTRRHSTARETKSIHSCLNRTVPECLSIRLDAGTILDGVSVRIKTSSVVAVSIDLGLRNRFRSTSLAVLPASFASRLQVATEPEACPRVFHVIE